MVSPIDIEAFWGEGVGRDMVGEGFSFSNPGR
jgi:hypothetical protein